MESPQTPFVKNDVWEIVYPYLQKGQCQYSLHKNSKVPYLSLAALIYYVVVLERVRLLCSRGSGYLAIFDKFAVSF